MDNIQKLLQDNRLCKSQNMQKFFSIEKNRRYNRIIRYNNVLYIANTEWGTEKKKEFAGVSVSEVARKGAKAETGYPSGQKPSMWYDATDWFWEKYWERGIVSIPEIWNRRIPRSLTSKEAHSI